MSSLDQFSIEITQLGVNIEHNVDTIVRKACIAISQTVIVATPVDTGRARSNWVVGIDAPRLDTRPSLANGAAATQMAINEATEIIQTFKNSNKEIRISNNLPYIQRLNEGYSAQAPAEFVTLAINNGLRYVEGAKVL